MIESIKYMLFISPMLNVIVEYAFTSAKIDNKLMQQSHFHRPRNIESFLSPVKLQGLYLPQ